MDVSTDTHLPDQPHNTGTLILLVAFAGLLIAGGIMYFSRSQPQRQVYRPPEPPAVTDTPPVTASPERQQEWKIYRDKARTFTVRHPTSLYETEDTPDPDSGREIGLGALSTVTPYNAGLDKASDLLMEFTLLTLPEGTDVDEYIQTHVLTYPREDTDGDGVVESPVIITPSVRKTIRPDGTKTEWLEGISFMSVPHAEAFIPYREDKVVHVRIFDGTGAQERPDQEQYRKNITLAEQILSTFQFLE